MSKKTKRIIQYIVLILVILGVGFYFLNEFYLKNRNSEPEAPNMSLEQIFEFKVMREDLTEEQVNDYQERFEQNVKRIQDSADNFDFSALNSMGMIKKALHDFEGAQDVWEYVSYMRPKNSLSFFNLANLYAEDLKDNERAEENFLKCLENAAGESGNEQYYLGVASFYRYFYPEKKEQIEKILLAALETEEYKESQVIFSLLATYYGENNQPQKAIEYWEKVLELDPGNAGVIEEIENLKN